jgi:hypothetical protein
MDPHKIHQPFQGRQLVAGIYVGLFSGTELYLAERRESFFGAPALLLQVFFCLVRGAWATCGAPNFRGRHGLPLEAEHFACQGKNRIPGNFEMNAFKAIWRPYLFHENSVPENMPGAHSRKQGNVI